MAGLEGVDKLRESLFTSKFKSSMSWSLTSVLIRTWPCDNWLCDGGVNFPLEGTAAGSLALLLSKGFDVGLTLSLAPLSTSVEKGLFGDAGSASTSTVSFLVVVVVVFALVTVFAAVAMTVFTNGLLVSRSKLAGATANGLALMDLSG